jgi:cytochrome b subunit of formate dehydrogenase
MAGGSIPVRVANQNKKENDEISLKTWIWIAILDILAVVITGLLIFSRH